MSAWRPGSALQGKVQQEPVRICLGLSAIAMASHEVAPKLPASTPRWDGICLHVSLHIPPHVRVGQNLRVACQSWSLLAGAGEGSLRPLVLRHHLSVTGYTLCCSHPPSPVICLASCGRLIPHGSCVACGRRPLWEPRHHPQLLWTAVTLASWALARGQRSSHSFCCEWGSRPVLIRTAPPQQHLLFPLVLLHPFALAACRLRAVTSPTLPIAAPSPRDAS